MIERLKKYRGHKNGINGINGINACVGCEFEISALKIFWDIWDTLSHLSQSVFANGCKVGYENASQNNPLSHISHLSHKNKIHREFCGFELGITNISSYPYREHFFWERDVWEKYLKLLTKTYPKMIFEAKSGIFFGMFWGIKHRNINANNSLYWDTAVVALISCK